MVLSSRPFGCLEGPGGPPRPLSRTPFAVCSEPSPAPPPFFSTLLGLAFSALEAAQEHIFEAQQRLGRRKAEMSSGLGEWEKGIPRMLHGSQRAGLMGRSAWPPRCSACPATHFWLPGPVSNEPSSPGCGQGTGSRPGSREPWPLFTVLVSTLAHKGESQALPSAPTGCETS